MTRGLVGPWQVRGKYSRGCSVTDMNHMFFSVVMNETANSSFDGDISEVGRVKRDRHELHVREAGIFQR